MELIAEAVERSGREAIPLEEAARRITAEARLQKRRLPGFGHRVHTHDPRTDVLFGMAREAGVAGKGIEFISALERAIGEQIRPLPVNIDGALAAVLFDMGFPAPFGKLVFIIGRVAGLTAEVAEEYTREKAMRIRIPVTYDGPPPREIE
jgi:citrate synthase